MASVASGKDCKLPQEPAMDFDDAIAAHTAWKRKLTKYLFKNDGSLTPVDVSADTRCALGQWIYSAGVKYASMSEYSALRREHIRFHKAAADVIERLNSGKSVAEETIVGSQSEFTMASAAVVLAIMAIKKVVNR